MRIAIFSDVHGNLPALDIMLKDAGKVDAYICLGDIVGYGPWSNECVEVVMNLKNCTMLRGNHEEYFSKKRYDGGNKLVQIFFDFCINDFNKSSLISNLKESYTLGRYIFTHTIKNKRIYPKSSIRLNGNYVIGHTHHQFKIAHGKYALYNTGSVGQNRKYINVINYLIYYPKKDLFEMKELVYDETLIINEMRTRKYPKMCINYYNNKKRK